MTCLWNKRLLDVRVWHVVIFQGVPLNVLKIEVLVLRLISTVRFGESNESIIFESCSFLLGVKQYVLESLTNSSPHTRR